MELAEEVEAPDLVCTTLNHLGLDFLLAAETAQAEEYFVRCVAACEQALEKAQLYSVLYDRAHALLGLSVVQSPGIASIPAGPADRDVGDPIMAAFREALAVCAEAGVVQEAIRGVEQLRRICERRKLDAPLVLDAVLALLRKEIEH